jgi:hypothetical protein
LSDYELAGQRVRSVVDESITDLPMLVRFMQRYTAWNICFGAGVSTLSAKIARSTALFRESGFPPAVADRSVLVASYFFDAARAEFNDGSTRHRDTHRCLAQAFLLGLMKHAETANPIFGDAAFLEKLFAPPVWLTGLGNHVGTGYGLGSPDDLASIFRAMGYHLGSEVLADQEFTHLDSAFRDQQPDLVTELEAAQIEIAGQAHEAYFWLRAHSALGDSAEADHFKWAVKGVHRAFDYLPESVHEELRGQIDLGYLEFARDHEVFFSKVNADPLPSS